MEHLVHGCVERKAESGVELPRYRMRTEVDVPNDRPVHLVTLTRAGVRQCPIACRATTAAHTTQSHVSGPVHLDGAALSQDDASKLRIQRTHRDVCVAVTNTR